MKNNLFIRITAVFLAFVLCFAGAISVAAKGAEENSFDCPMIYIHGFMASNILADSTDPDSESLWPPSTESILDAVGDALIPLAKLAANHNWDAFGDELVPIVDKLFEPVCADYNGDITNGSGVNFEYPTAEEIEERTEENKEICFDYDWRGNPVEIAAQLDDFVDYVLECTDDDQVTIVCHSLGGVITLSYLKLYGNEKVRAVMFDSTAIYGETYTGELLTGQLEVSPESLMSYLAFAFDNTDAEELLARIMQMLEEAGLVDFVCDFADKFIAELYDQVALSLLKIFANWPTIWAMVPDDLLSQAEAYVFGEVYKNENIDFTGLKEKLDSYNTLVRNGKTQALLEISKDTNVYVLSRYGYSSLPLTPSWHSLGDGVVDTKNNSFGATTAPYGKTLGLPAGEYVSPDGTVDASTCLFPEQTWFIKSIKHSDYPGCLDPFYIKILYTEGRATVNTYDEYPRFMKYDCDTDSFKPDGVQVSAPTFFEALWLAILNLFNTLKSFFVK